MTFDGQKITQKHNYNVVILVLVEVVSPYRPDISTSILNVLLMRNFQGNHRFVMAM